MAKEDRFQKLQIVSRRVKHCTWTSPEHNFLALTMIDLIKKRLVVRMEMVTKHLLLLLAFGNATDAIVKTYNWANIDIVIICVRTVNDDRTSQAVDVLSRVMTMPPAHTVELRADSVGEGLSGRDRTLTNSGHTVIPGSPGLEETMPMNGGSLTGVHVHVIGDLDLDVITPIGLKKGTRELSVDDHLVWGQRLLQVNVLVVLLTMGVITPSGASVVLVIDHS